MPSELVGGRPGLARLPSTKTGAVAQDVTFTFDPRTDAKYAAFMGTGFEACIVKSPINSAGSADIEVRSGSFVDVLAGGGNQLTVPGPITALKLTPRNAAVAGTGTDDITVTPIATLKTRV